MPYKESELPSKYWRDYITRAVARRKGEIGATILSAQRAGIFPEMPIELLIAFTSTGGLGDNTTDARTGAGAQVSFHEIGLFQIPAGNANRNAQGIPQSPAPNRDPNAPNNTWGRYHATDKTKNFLNRRDENDKLLPAPMDPNAWKTDLKSQVAIGLQMLEAHYKEVSAACDPSVRPTSAATPWGCALAMMGFSAGSAGAAAVVKRYASKIAGANEKQRFGALIHAMCLEIASGWDPGGTPDRHSNLAHRVLRTWQKTEFARQIALQTGGKTGFFDVFLGDTQPVHERVLLRGNWRMKPVGTDVIAPVTFTPTPVPS